MQTKLTKDINMEIGVKIRKERLIQGLSTQELADKLGISRGNLSMIELGNTLPSLCSLSNIANALGYKLGITFVSPAEEKTFSGDIFSTEFVDHRFSANKKKQ